MKYFVQKETLIYLTRNKEDDLMNGLDKTRGKINVGKLIQSLTSHQNKFLVFQGVKVNKL